ncbi:MAG: apolipoprotein N-acyltransferase, partial [Desulfosalsimonadaceae bacterium]
YGSLRLYAVDRRLAGAERLDVAVVQGNIDQMQKWDDAFRRLSLDRHFRLSQAAKNPEPELIVWPETAVPFYFQYRREATERLLVRARQTGAALLIGAPSVEREGKKTAYYNSAYLISSEGEVLESYDKVHLVPFGEYVPFRKWLFFIDTLVAQVGNFESGEKGDTISRPPADIGMLICYEAIFPGLSAEMTKNGAAFLVNITNDAWFGNTGAPRQHFSMAVLRAVENRRSLVRAANTGISGFIDAAGRIKETSRLFEEAVKSRSIALIEDYRSFYTRYTDVFALACLVATGALLMLRLLIREKRMAGKFFSGCSIHPE